MTTTARSKPVRPVRAVIYCRMSLARHGNKVKVKRQEKMCRKLAKSLGWEVVHVFCDNNKSAWKRNRKRPDWDEMLQWIQDGRVDAVILYHGDRLIRQPFDLETLLSLAEGKGLRLASPMGTRNLDDPDDRFRLRQDVAKACSESDTISRRTKVVHEERARKGKWKKGGRRAFGYTRKGKVMEAEAAHYRDAVARLVAGESRTSVIRDWNTRGVLTTSGNQWRYASFNGMISRARYAGLSVYHGEVVAKGRWEPLIDRETWEALTAVLAVGTALYTGNWGTRPSGSAKYLLSGIATHEKCGTPVGVHHSTRAGAGKTSYCCPYPGCRRGATRNQQYTDEYVIGRVLELLADPRLWEQIDAASSVDDGVPGQLVALKARRQSTMDLFAKGTEMSEAELAGMLREMNRQIEELQERLARRQAGSALDGCRDLSREEWNALPMDRRRRIVRRLVTVELLAAKIGRGFDTSSVRVTRRKGDADAGKGAGGGLELVASGGGPAPE